MKLNELRPNEGGGNRPRKRVGRGMSSGHGKTSGRGHDGQKSRSGGGVRPGFEGGQMPLFRRLPKRGFANIFAKEYAIVNIEALNRFNEDTVVTPELLVEEGIVKKGKAINGIKILGDGEIKVKLIVQAQKFSKTAAEKIEAAGGKAEVV